VGYLRLQCKRALLYKVAAQPYQHVYVSPHFDDAAFSCGGSITQQRRNDEPILVITVCTGSAHSASTAGAATRRADPRLGAFEDILPRRAEDAAAMRDLGVDHQWLGERDAVVRHRRYRSLVGATGRPLRNDAGVMRRLAAAVAGLELAPGARLYFPLAIGNHVDHQVAFAAGMAVANAPPDGCEVVFYEDVPYALVPHLLRQRLQRLRVTYPSHREQAGTGATLFRRTRETVAALLQLPLISRQMTKAMQLALAGYVLAGHAGLLGGGRPIRGQRNGRRLVALTAEVHNTSNEHEAKLRAAACYATQVAEIMGSVAALEVALRRYASATSDGAAISVERIWHAALAAV
jgi:LmbE family N-acetylglucosaminyl deacetylase